MATTRVEERLLASLGKLQVAPIRFEAVNDVPKGGVLCALPALLALGLLRHSVTYFTWLPGYYPLETIFLIEADQALLQQALHNLMEAGRLSFEWSGKIAAFDKEAQEGGHVQFVGGISKAPFDVIPDTLRGTQAMMGDLFRRPEKVLKAIERLTPLQIKWGLSGPEVSGNPIVFMPLHKGADGWMSDEHFRTFYWPSLKAAILALIDQGCVPFLFADGGYNSRLQYIRELPKGRCIWMFDRTDMAKAKEIVGNTTCISGNAPISKIMTGTPDKVRQICKELIDVAGIDGGYIMAMGCSALSFFPRETEYRLMHG